MHVLLSAYACKPNSGSEEGNGWGWATHLAARGLRVHVLTVSRDQVEIEFELQRKPIPNLSFTFLEPDRKGLKVGHSAHYLAWQFAALRVAKRLNATDAFDLVHHVTYGSIHIPSQLWRLGIPVIFGPVGGGQISPFSMRSYFGSSQRSELLRTWFTKALRFSPLHRRWINRMTVVFATNEESLVLAKQLGKKDAVLSLDVGLPRTFLAKGPKNFQQRDSPLRLLWTGRMMPRKALGLTLDAVAKTNANVALTIVGGGYNPQILLDMIRTRGLENVVHWTGNAVPWSQIPDIYTAHDALLFTSLRDSCAAQLLEAMASGLPIITLDLHGGRLLVPDDAGYKVPVAGKESTVSAISRAIEAFALSTNEQKNAMSLAGWEAAHNFTFDVRAKRAEHLYRSILAANALKKEGSSRSVQLRMTDVEPI